MSQPATILLLLKRVDCVDGVAAYLETLLTGLREAGDRVVIVSGDVTTPDGSEGRRRAIEAASLGWLVLDGFSASRPVLRHLRQIRALIRQHDVDVVSPQGFSVLPVATLLGLLSGRRVVANYHPSLHGDQAAAMTGRRSRRERLSYRALAAICRPERFIALSRDIARFFRDECGIAPARIHEQVLGVETGFYRAPTDQERRDARARFGLDERALVCVLPGRMNLSKGHDVAVAALRALRQRRPDLGAVCLFPGGGDQRQRIEAEALRDDADRETFRFLGFVSRDVLRDAYWAADIVLLPSRMEGFGLVVAEAMCCGAIAIRTPSGGWQDQVIEGRTGTVVPYNDPPALAAAIERIADHPDRAAMRDEVMAYASEKFAKSRMIEGTSALYRQVASRLAPPA